MSCGELYDQDMSMVVLRGGSEDGFSATKSCESRARQIGPELGFDRQVGAFVVVVGW